MYQLYSGVEALTHQYNGRYSLAREVEDNIPSLDRRLVKQAKNIKLSLFPVSALDLIKEEEKAELFKKRVFPLEIAKGLFPQESYEHLDFLNSIEKIKWKERTGSLGMIERTMSPFILANHELGYAFHSVYEVVFGEESEKVKEIKKIWTFE